jgi:hypothetical protein
MSRKKIRLYLFGKVMHRISMSCFVLSLVVAVSFSGSASAQLIDFETVPGGVSADQLPISNQYQSLYGVTFSTVNPSGVPYLEAVGNADPGYGFYRSIGGDYDQGRSQNEANQLKSFFLRFGTGNGYANQLTQLLITYTNPVSAASAQIWDIDANSNGYEQWLVQARDAGNNVIGSASSPIGISGNDPASLDGLPWTWSFNEATADIYSITLDYVGTKQTGIGLAFDNFNTSDPAPTPTPEPSTALLFGAGFIALIGLKLRKRLISRSVIPR